MQASNTLPPLFVRRMRTLLGSGAGALFAAYDHSPHSGLRVNLLRLSAEHFRQIAPWPLEPVPWCPSGFYLADDARPGRHPYHAAGLYYVQEPSAMAVVEALDIQPGGLILDLAAAPGGKATHIAALLGGEGLLIANEIERRRVKALGENLERWGARNVVITNAAPAQLVDALGPIFDRVLLDAPCSGEGMFRKHAAARMEWSPEHVAGCAVRQAHLLEWAAQLVRPGGALLYSTCTFAPEENEQRIATFLDAHAGWELIDLPKRHGIVAARPDWAGERPRPELERAVRLWPQELAGEGHFIALLLKGKRATSVELPARRSHRTGSDRRGKAPPRREQRTRPETGLRAAIAAWSAFERQSLAVTLPVEHLLARNDLLYLQPAECPDLHGLRVVRPGLWLGTLRPGRFEPSHALALALCAGEARQEIALDAAEATDYLRGATLENAGPDGWTLVTVDGWPLGWGRRAGGVVKNFYPKGLRWSAG